MSAKPRYTAQPRYTVHEYVDHAWGGTKFGVWDHALETWADDVGWFMSRSAATVAVEHANNLHDAQARDAREH